MNQGAGLPSFWRDGLEEAPRLLSRGQPSLLSLCLKNTQKQGEAILSSKPWDLI